MLNLNKVLFNSRPGVSNLFSKTFSQSVIKRNFASLAKFNHLDALNLESLLTEEEKMVIILFDFLNFFKKKK